VDEQTGDAPVKRCLFLLCMFFFFFFFWFWIVLITYFRTSFEGYEKSKIKNFCSYNISYDRS
jgi:hypothetical protein